MAICGAKTRNGDSCKKQPVTGRKRCRLHGGLSPGAPRGNRNAAKPGSLHSKYLTAEEQALLPLIPVGSLDDELGLTRVLLLRALAKENRHRLQMAEAKDKVEQIRKEIAVLEAKRMAIIERQAKHQAFECMLRIKHKRTCWGGMRFRSIFQEQPHESAQHD